jgi:murein DD-endopeptidase MepM/ murein hydrolase activator NlpD
MKRNKTLSLALIGALTVSTLFIGGSIPALAETRAQIQKRIDDRNKEKKELLERLSQYDKDDLNAQKNAKQVRIGILEDEIDEYNKIIGEADAELARLDVEIQESEEMFRRRLRMMDETGVSTYMEALLESESLSDFFARVETVKEVSRQDKRIIDNMVELQTQRRDRRQAQVIAREEAERQKTDLERESAAVEDLLARLASDEKRKAALDAELEKAAADMTRLLAPIQSTQSSGRTYVGGVFLWPVPGRSAISSSFGPRKSPGGIGSTNHQGVDIPTPTGSQILAANGGRVSLAAWNGGYGYCVVIDHGGGQSTLYGHNSKLLASAGQEVKKGDVIALAGSTGNSTGPHCHFEVRINGAPVNPMNYFS